MINPRTTALRPLKGTRIVSLALNLPGPAALMRCQHMGARCTKFEPPSGDPMRHYNPAAFAALHAGIGIRTADLKSQAGQNALHQALGKADVLMTSFRPSALGKLGLGFKALHKQYPQLCQVAIVGGQGARAEEPGHDLTYLAEQGLVTGLNLPPTLYADMGGSIMASEAVLAVLMQRAKKSTGVFVEVPLSEAAAYLALPRSWGLTLPGAAVGGGHAGYQIYACKDGRVAVAALEPHFAARLCAAAGVALSRPQDMFEAATQQQLGKYFKRQSCAALTGLAAAHDIPLHALAG